MAVYRSVYCFHCRLTCSYYHLVYSLPELRWLPLLLPDLQVYVTATHGVVLPWLLVRKLGSREIAPPFAYEVMFQNAHCFKAAYPVHHI